ncbi:hypothetical protein [Ensifer sp. MJa1]|jgi:hypothetical protein
MARINHWHHGFVLPGMGKIVLLLPGCRETFPQSGIPEMESEKWTGTI